MGVHLRPVGPLPAEVYWRRRLLVLGLLVLVLGGSLGGLGAALSGPQEPSAQRSGPAAPPAAAPADPAAPAAPAPAGSASPSASAQPAACTLSDVAVSPRTDAALYRVGDWPRLRLELRGTGPVPCTASVRPGELEVHVVSGADRVWSSAQCPLPRQPSPVLVRPGASAALESSWPARRSRPGCRGPVEEARPGTYRLVAQVGAEQVPGSTFTLLPR